MGVCFAESYFFGVVVGFVAQAGIAANPAVSAEWRYTRILDDPPLASNVLGSLSYAFSGANSRTTQVCVCDV